MSLLPLIPAERLLLESDSPFIRFKMSHPNALLQLSESIREVKTNVTLWGNFKALLQ
jgi:Tat protein secretion system quality control protein TatD with DNase activity